ncbi:MAG: hypothetical protein R3308_03205 [Thiohalobacterales bacterium]|nr:hypothetical protein [Thiohalobacterales bacterium]
MEVIVGRPRENIAFWTSADQVSCLLVEDPHGMPQSGDEVVDCSYENPDWIQLGYVDLSSYGGGCVKQARLGGKNSAKGGGKTPFCDITGEFEVDENNTTSKAKAQVFVSHTGSAPVKGGKISGKGSR